MTVSLHLFAFPVNLIVGLCIVFLGWKFRKMYRETYMTIALLLLIAVSLVQGFMPVHIAFTRTWPFVAVLSVFLIVLSSRLFLKFSLPVSDCGWHCGQACWGRPMPLLRT